MPHLEKRNGMAPDRQLTLALDHDPEGEPVATEPSARYRQMDTTAVTLLSMETMGTSGIS